MCLHCEGQGDIPSCPTWKTRVKDKLPYCLVIPPVYEVLVSDLVYPASLKEDEMLELMARLKASPPNPILWVVIPHNPKIWAKTYNCIDSRGPHGETQL